MRIVNQLQIGPFTTEYHRGLVNDAFVTALQSFLERKHLSQADSLVLQADGTLTATFDDERHCGPRSLVRDIFTLDVVLYCEDGNAELAGDIVFDPASCSFKSRNGYDRFFYLWTPARKAQREEEMALIQRTIDDIEKGRAVAGHCPICGSELAIVNDRAIFVVRCRGKRCFNYNYHKDEDGRLLHGHFFTHHPRNRKR